MTLHGVEGDGSGEVLHAGQSRRGAVPQGRGISWRRSRFSAFLAALALPAALVACGGPTAPTTMPTSSSIVVADDAPPEVVAPDMSPVEKPGHVFLTARLTSVAKSIDTVDKLVKLPKSIRSQLDFVVEKRGMTFIDLDGSVDVAVGLDAGRKEDVRFVSAFSLPIKSLDDAVAAAKKLGAEVSSAGPSAYHVRGKGLVCDLGPSLGTSQYRAVCSEREAALETLGPWLVRGFAADPKPAGDGWARVDIAPFRAKIGALRDRADELVAKMTKDVSRALPRADKEVLEAPSVLESELFAIAEDLDYLEGSFKLDANKPAFDVAFDAHFRSKTSWVAGLVDESAANGSAPPELFFRLPKDATSAFYSHSADPAKFAGIRRVVYKGLTALLDVAGSKLKISDADKTALLAWVDGFPTVSGTWVSASGPAASKARPAKDLTAQQAIDGFKGQMQAILPWSISGGDGDPAKSIAWLKLTEDAVTKAVADVKSIAGKDASKLTFLPVAKVTNNPAGYPKGSSELKVTVSVTSKMIWELLPENRGVPHPQGAEAKGDVSLYIVVAPDDAGHYWWGYSFDGDALKSHLVAALKGAAATGQLSSRTDLDALKNHKGFGGFISIGGALASLGPLTDRRFGDDLTKAIEVAPHKFAGNIFFLGGGTSGAAPSVSIDVSLGKDWIEDLSALVQAVAR